MNEYNLPRNLYELTNKFPQVSVVADKYNFTCEDIESLINKAYKYLNHHLYNKGSIEVSLKALLVRLDMNRNDFYKYVEQVHVDLADADSFIKLVGSMQVPVLWALTN